MKYVVLDTKNVTPKATEEEYENGDVRQIEEVILLLDDEPDPHEIAFRVFRNAKYVVPLGCERLPQWSGDKKFIAKYRVTHPSPSEREESYIYGDD